MKQRKGSSQIVQPTGLNAKKPKRNCKRQRIGFCSGAESWSATLYKRGGCLPIGGNSQKAAKPVNNAKMSETAAAKLSESIDSKLPGGIKAAKIW